MFTDRLFESLALGDGIVLKNRLVMAPMTTTSGELDGRFSEAEIEYLVRRAQSDIGLVMTPACYCHKSGHSFDRQVGCHSDEMIPRMKMLANSIRQTGAVSFLQIHHGGNAAKKLLSGSQPVAPSAVHNRRGTSELPRAMTEAEIHEIIDAFAKAAGRAKAAGFDGIELHGANTYLFQQFFSPFTNRREDRWGCQNMDNRSRFAREVVTAVRAELGAGYPIAYRISPEEPDPDGYSTAEAVELLRLLISLGVDIVHVSSWAYGEGLRHDWPEHSHPSRLIRDSLPSNIPVIGVGSVSSPIDALRVLDDGLDLVAIGRSLLLDADWATKVRNNRVDLIRHHISTEAELQSLEIPHPMRDYIRRWVFD